MPQKPDSEKRLMIDQSAWQKKAKAMLSETERSGKVTAHDLAIIINARDDR